MLTCLESSDLRNQWHIHTVNYKKCVHALIWAWRELVHLHGWFVDDSYGYGPLLSPSEPSHSTFSQIVRDFRQDRQMCVPCVLLITLSDHSRNGIKWLVHKVDESEIPCHLIPGFENGCVSKMVACWSHLGLRQLPPNFLNIKHRVLSQFLHIILVVARHSYLCGWWGIILFCMVEGSCAHTRYQTYSCRMARVWLMY